MLAKAIRNAAIITWLKRGSDGRLLPGTRNTLADLAQGYASWLGAPLDEVKTPNLLTDSDFLDWVWQDRYASLIIEAHPLHD